MTIWGKLFSNNVSVQCHSERSVAVFIQAHRHAD